MDSNCIRSPIEKVPSPTSSIQGTEAMAPILARLSCVSSAVAVSPYGPVTIFPRVVTPAASVTGALAITVPALFLM